MTSEIKEYWNDRQLETRLTELVNQYNKKYLAGIHQLPKNLIIANAITHIHANGIDIRTASAFVNEYINAWTWTHLEFVKL